MNTKILGFEVKTIIMTTLAVTLGVMLYDKVIKTYVFKSTTPAV